MATNKQQTANPEKVDLKVKKRKNSGLISPGLQQNIMTYQSFLQLTKGLRKEFGITLQGAVTLIFIVSEYAQGNFSTNWSISKGVESAVTPGMYNLMKERVKRLIEFNMVFIIGVGGVHGRTNKYAPTHECLALFNRLSPGVIPDGLLQAC